MDLNIQLEAHKRHMAGTIETRKKIEELIETADRESDKIILRLAVTELTEIIDGLQAKIDDIETVLRMTS